MAILWGRMISLILWCVECQEYWWAFLDKNNNSYITVDYNNPSPMQFGLKTLTTCRISEGYI